MSLPLQEGIELIRLASKKENTECMFRQWLALLPNMRKENFMTFDKFRESIEHQNSIDTRPTAVILAELDAREQQQEGNKHGNL